MFRHSINVLWAVVFLTFQVWGASDDGTPELIEGPKASAVWRRLVQSQSNLDVLTHARLIARVPAVPSGNGVSDLVAGFASLAWFREGQFFDPDARMMYAVPVVHRALEKPLAGTKKSKRSMIEYELLEKLKMEYFPAQTKDQAKPSQASDGEVFVQTIQGCFDRVQNNNGVERLKEAISAFMKNRDLSVTVTVEDASWDRCRETVNRDLPFLCLLGDRNKPLILVCVGYAEANNKRYLVVLDPKHTQLQKQRVADMMTDVDRALGGEAVAVIRALGGDAIDTDYYKTRLISEPIPGLAVVAVHASPVRCVFFHKWRQDEKAMQDRIERIINRNNAAK